MGNLVDLYSETGAGLTADDTVAALTLSNATVGPALRLVRLGAGAASIGVVQISASGASVPVLQFQANALVSAVSLIFAASANWAGMAAIRVQYPNGTSYGWIPVLPDGQVTAAVVA